MTFFQPGHLQQRGEQAVGTTGLLHHRGEQSVMHSWRDASQQGLR